MHQYVNMGITSNKRKYASMLIWVYPIRESMHQYVNMGITSNKRKYASIC